MSVGSNTSNSDNEPYYRSSAISTFLPVNKYPLLMDNKPCYSCTDSFLSGTI